MSESNNKSYRIKANVGADSYLNVKLDQDYDSFDILSLNIDYKDTYRLHNSNKGIIVGRVLANNGFGIPNAKISVFISADTENDSEEMLSVYSYSTVSSKDGNGVRYNLLEDYKVSDCHRPVGTFPSKRYLLDNGTLMEVFDKYYTLTTKTNEAGDYMLVGVPKGNNTIHMDLDLSDCGILSQKPRDFVYKGYNIEQFDSPSQFKTGTSLNSLSQIFSQDTTVFVNPFWGNDSLGETIGISRCDINVNFKFEPTCVFIGSVVSDPASKGISQKCIPHEEMGRMDELTTGEGTIEMIRKTPSGAVEVFPIKGNLLIDGDGVWCYQIPMNLDYVVTDEYGNMVATDDPDKGIPTRTRVRFRFSMSEFEKTSDNFFRAKILVPHNPQYEEANSAYTLNEDFYDYDFGTKTKDESFRDLMWNNVYTVKQYIPRFQKSKRYKDERFTGIKACNHYGQNNPMPYNNIRIRLPFMFRLLCALIKAYIRILIVLNRVFSWLCETMRRMSRMGGLSDAFQSRTGGLALKTRLAAVADGLCPDLENWYFTPYNGNNIDNLVFTTKSSGSDGGPKIEGNTVGSGLCATSTTITSTATTNSSFELSGTYAKYIVCFALSSVEQGGDAVESWHIKCQDDPSSHGQWVKVDDKLHFWTAWNRFYGYQNGNTSGTLVKRDKVKKTEGTVTIKGYSITVEYWYNESLAERDSEKLGTTWWTYAKNTLEQYDSDGHPKVNLYNQTLQYLIAQDGSDEYPTESRDTQSIDTQNESTADSGKCLTTKTDYLISCIEMNLAQEYRVINFDFYNDWLNGVLYFPRWGMNNVPKIKYKNGKIITYEKTRGCIADPSIYSTSRLLYQQCSLKYSAASLYTTSTTPVLKLPSDTSQNFHKNSHKSIKYILGNNGGVVKQKETMVGDTVYYYKPCEWDLGNESTEGLSDKNNFHQKINLFATDIVLLGSMDDCSMYGIPKAFEHMSPSSYKMPTNLALTNMDTNAYLYGMSDGTFCNGAQGLSASSSSNGVSQLDTTYVAQDKYFSGMNNTDERISYIDDQTARSTYGDTQLVIDDLFPVTEAAGIAWNYTGPGQGTSTSAWTTNYMGYQPGGHFLGLTCNNSTTNVKTCLNLQRICEMGVTMSQRKIKVYGMDGNSFKHRYFVPTGFISSDEVSDTSFRAMFATMNMRPLIVSSANTNSNTGYFCYPFLYRCPSSFHGESSYNFKTSGNENSNQYNESVDMSKEKADYTYMYENNDGMVGKSFDLNELTKTYRRTLELTSADYTSFRFGTTDATRYKLHYAVKPGTGATTPNFYEIPIYENSFYFYFGLHEGSTAFDKFKDNFYADCPNSGDSNSAYMVVTKSDIAMPTNNKFSITLYNMQSPYTIIVKSGEKSYELEETGTNTYSVTGLPYGTYSVSVTDDNGTTLTTEVTFSEPTIEVYYIVNEADYTGTTKGDETLRENYLRDCGYIDIDRNVSIDGTEYDLASDNICVLVRSNPVISTSSKIYYYNTSDNSYFDNMLTELITDETAYGVAVPTEKISKKPYMLMDVDSFKMYLPDNDVNYTITLLYKDSDNNVGTYMIGEFTV